MLIDPWGKVLAERAQEGPGVVVADLSWDLMQQCRGRLPALEHRLL
jgi:nitrilase